MFLPFSFSPWRKQGKDTTCVLKAPPPVTELHLDAQPEGRDPPNTLCTQSQEGLLWEKHLLQNEEVQGKTEPPLWLKSFKELSHSEQMCTEWWLWLFINGGSLWHYVPQVCGLGDKNELYPSGLETHLSPQNKDLL